MDDVAGRRLHVQRLEGDPLPSAAAVVAHLGAVQAQDYGVARWSIGLRGHGIGEAEVDAALAAGDLVRTHVLRDTWHLVAREDLRWLLDLTAGRILQRNATMHRREGLDDAMLERTDAVLAAAVADGPRTRKELVAALTAAGVAAPERFRLAYILMHAELRGVLCSGPLRGAQHTHIALERVAPAEAPLDRDEALCRLARRFLAGHAPAAVEDLARWATLPLAEARRAVAALADGVETQPLPDGRTLLAPPDAPSAAPVPRRAHLLQAWDEYVNGYLATRDAADPDGLLDRPVPGGAPLQHLVIHAGRVVARWRRRLTARTVAVDLQPLRPLDATEDAAIAAAVERHAAFVGRTLA